MLRTTCLLAGVLVGCADPAPEGLAVTVVVPNGGEALVAAEPVTVQWELAVPDGAGAVETDIELVDEAGGATVLASGVGGTSLEWTPPGVVEPTAFRVRVTARAGGGAVDDASDELFTVSPPASGVSLARDVQPIFELRCNTRFCHGADSQVALLNLAAGAARAQLVDVPSTSAACRTFVRVRAGMPDQSYLLWKLTGSGACFSGVRMPKNAPALGAAELNLIRDWIAEGARAN